MERRKGDERRKEGAIGRAGAWHGVFLSMTPAAAQVTDVPRAQCGRAPETAVTSSHVRGRTIRAAFAIVVNEPTAHSSL